MEWYFYTNDDFEIDFYLQWSPVDPLIFLLTCEVKSQWHKELVWLFSHNVIPKRIFVIPKRIYVKKLAWHRSCLNAFWSAACWWTITLVKGSCLGYWLMDMAQKKFCAVFLSSFKVGYSNFRTKQYILGRKGVWNKRSAFISISFLRMSPFPSHWVMKYESVIVNGTEAWKCCMDGVRILDLDNFISYLAQ